MSMRDLLAELEARRKKALEMGGAERIAKQRARGKGTARERIAMLFDQGSFQEYGQLASHLGEHARTQSMEEISAADAVVFGVGRIDGRHACAVAEDFTVHGGTFGLVHGRKKLRAVELASRERVPIVWMLDGAGARAQEMIGEGLPEGPHYFAMARHSGVAPQVALVMGPSAGDSSLIASLCEFIVMVEGASMLAAGGPPIVKAATGQTVDKEELGGAAVHCRLSGVADNAARDELEAIALAKQFLSYLPTNAWEWPPRAPCFASDDARQEELARIVPDDPRKPYDIKRVIECVCDAESLLEIGPQHAQMIITGLARIEGHPVGVVANQPIVHGGAITAAAARKARHFIDLCSAYHVPLLFLEDVPGVMPGPQSEREGVLRAGLALAYSLAWSDAPKVTVILRKAFGFGACAMGGGANSGQTLILAWPGAMFGSLPAKSAVLTAHAAELAAAPDRIAAERGLIENYERCNGAFHAAGKANIDDVVHPQETRARIAAAFALARNRRTAPPAPTFRRGVMP